MKNKQLVSILLALMLMLGVMPVSASGETSTPNKITKQPNFVVQAPIIKVTVATTAGIIANPLKLEYTNENEELEIQVAAPPGNTPTLVSAQALITNKSNAQLNVTATPTVAKVTSDSYTSKVSFPGTAGGVSGGGPAAYMFLELVGSDKATESGYSGWGTPGASSTTDGFSIIVEGDTNADPAKAVLNAATLSDTTVAKTALEDSVTPGYGAYKISGAAGGGPWMAGDLFKVTIIFSFEVVKNSVSLT